MTSTSIPAEKKNKLIHIASIFQGDQRYIFLRQTAADRFTWFEEKDGNQEIETSVSGPTIQEALRLAARHWKQDTFRTVICGFRYTLPERDEHGINALFHQMVASYGTMNGIYYDEELGNNCFVQNASAEAYTLWKKLTNQNRL